MTAALHWMKQVKTAGMNEANSKYDWASMFMRSAAMRRILRFGLVLACLVLPREVLAQRAENPIAVFAALDKVTARISPLEIRIGETMKFGALTVTPRVCYTRPPTEPPLTSAFVEVDEIKLSGERQRIFSGWMFAQSPGLHAVEHPVFDVWLTNCKTEEPEAPAGNLEKSPAPSNASSKRR